MTKTEKAQVHDILDALVQNERRFVSHDASTIVHQAANRESDPAFKLRLTAIAHEIEGLCNPPTESPKTNDAG